MTSIRALWPRHFSVNDLLQKGKQVFRHRQRHTDATRYAGLSNSIAVSREVCKAQVNLTVPNPHLGKQISTDRLNILSANNTDGIVSELNHFAGRGFTHRQLLLLIDENGEAYDMAGRKWSLAA